MSSSRLPVPNSWAGVPGEDAPDRECVDPAVAEVLVLAADIGILEDCAEAPLLDLIPEAQARSIRSNRQPEDRRRRILARLLLAFGLGILDNWDMRTGLAAVRHEPQGRPWVAGCSRPISISHAGQWAVCGIGQTHASGGIGVDVEKIRPLDAEDFRLVFTLRECAAIRKAANPASELIRRWTIKEAVLKSGGTGLLADPLQVDTEGATDGAGIQWRHLPLAHDYWLTVAGQMRSATARLVLPSRNHLITGGLISAPSRKLPGTPSPCMA